VGYHAIHSIEHQPFLFDQRSAQQNKSDSYRIRINPNLGIFQNNKNCTTLQDIRVIRVPFFHKKMCHNGRVETMGWPSVLMVWNVQL
jgi:hypothetical protein